jgi:alpha-ketoglutaric semialdehyde dehydrogenase
MTITGELLIDGGARPGAGGSILAVDPSTGAALDVRRRDQGRPR